MLPGKVTVPNTSGDMSVKAIPIVSIGGVTSGSIRVLANSGKEIISGRCSFTVPPGGETVWIYCDDAADSEDAATWPTAQQVVDNGTAVQNECPISIQDPGGSPSLPDLTKYFAAMSTAIVGDLRVIS
jgi:hypothetical protein